MRGLEEFQPAPLLERDLAVGELDLEISRHVTGAEQDRDVLQSNSFFVQLENAVNDKSRLLLLILSGHQPRRFARITLGPQILGKPLSGARDHRIRDREYLRSGPIVLLESDDCAPLELLRETEDVAEVRAAERVDALGVITDHCDVGVLAAHPAKHPRLKNIRVLILVDQYVIVEAGDPVGELRRRFEHQCPEQQEVIVVDEVPLLFPERVVGENLREIIDVLYELPVFVADDVIDSNARVDVAGVHVLKRLFLREPLRFLRVAQLRARELHEVRRIALVHDAEVPREAGVGPESLQEPVRGGVKRPAVNLPARRANKPLGPGQHLLRGAPGECQEEDSVRPDTLLDQVSNAVDECSCLSCARTRDDEKRAIAVGRCRGLLRVQLSGEVARSGGFNDPLAGGIDLRRCFAHRREIYARGPNICRRFFSHPSI